MCHLVENKFFELLGKTAEQNLGGELYTSEHGAAYKMNCYLTHKYLIF